MKNIISDRISNKQIIKDFISNFIGSLSGKSFNFALGLMLLDQTKSAMSFGINMIIYPLVSLIFLVPIGNLVDRYPHKKILIYNFIFRIFTFLLFYAFYFLMDSSSILYLVIPFVILHSITVNISDTCYSASIHELVNDKKIQRLSSVTQTAIAIATMLSPAIGVIFYGWLGFAGFILIEIFANLLSLGVLLSMKFYYEYNEQENKATNCENPLHGIKEIIQFLKENQIVKYIILVSVILNFFYTSISIGVPFVLKEQLLLDNSTVGMLETMAAVGMLLASISMSLLPDKKENNILLSSKITMPLVLLTMAIIGLGITFASTNSQIIISFLGSIFMGIIAFTLVVLNIIVMTYLQSTIETKFLGRVMSTLFTLNTSIMPIGTIVFTYLFQKEVNGGLIFIFGGVTLLIYITIMLPKIFRILRLE
ncbi:MFS transporter [Streptococcus oralis subsp. tigurinus]|uniref:MFS transporter n=1 Tax=Streptococcus oralis subsp. tigurinus TaxID=1077464 RepID=A0A1X1G0G0_STROR|nr:MFS transporter [Streptococcus oralis]MCY7079590.1 MFS transporter [Streptococcus oralis]ORO40075.1 MFS transporter [Streptococcus oralis subsp. tigurinus]BBA09329.1 Transporter, major facilitator family protein [Streptococcus oralis subsp. tigurinus]